MPSSFTKVGTGVSEKYWTSDQAGNPLYLLGYDVHRCEP